MANLADCAFAIAKEDILKTDGAIRRANPGEKCTMVTKSKYKDGNDEYIYWFKWTEGPTNSCRLVKNGVTIIDTTDEKEIAKTTDMLRNMERVGFTETIKDVHVENGWAVDWRKLNSYSYDYTPSICEFEDHLTVYFGGRWSFPSSLEDSLNNYGVMWQGAGCEDGCDWQDDEMGNTDFGLRVKSEKSEWQDDDGNYIYQHYVEDTSI